MNRYKDVINYNKCYTPCEETCHKKAGREKQKVVRVVLDFLSRRAEACADLFPGPRCPHPGFHVRLFHQALLNLGYSVRWIRPNGTAALFAALRSGDWDLHLPMMTYSYFTRTIVEAYDIPATVDVDISRPIYTDVFNFLHRNGLTEESSAGLLAHIGSWALWLSLAGFFGAVFGFDRLLKALRPTHWALNIVRVSRAAWYVALAIIFGVYSNFLAITLSVPPAYRPLFSDFLGYSRLLGSRAFQIIRAYEKHKPMVVKSSADVLRAIQAKPCRIGCY